jgi:aryl-alcohol dehydrogenase-like predicted oxidoreductase
VCNFSSAQLRAALECTEITTVQFQYSLLERSVEKDIRKICVDNDIALLAYGPLGGGVLTGKYRERPRFSMRDARTLFYRYYSEKRWPRVAALVEEMRRMAEARGTVPGALAMAWLLSRPAVGAVLAGAKTPDQTKENILAADLRLSPTELDALTALSDSVTGAMKTDPAP